MNCPQCKIDISDIMYNHIETCPNCGYKLNSINWVTVAKEYPPNDLIIESLLKSSGIPVKLSKREVSGFPVSIGPLAEVKILVPDNLSGDAKIIISDFTLTLDQNLLPHKEEP